MLTVFKTSKYQTSHIENAQKERTKNSIVNDALKINVLRLNSQIGKIVT